MKIPSHQSAHRSAGPAFRLPGVLRLRDARPQGRRRRAAQGRRDARPALPERDVSAFTMIEIAIAIAVIGFALVAIIGILPRGLEVQRDNRSETLINQDGTFWIEAIRNGARGLDELPDYVSQIDINDENGNPFPGSPYSNFQFGADIIGLLTTQAAIPNADVTAQVWAISGSAAEKDFSDNKRIAFRYLLRVQIHQATNTALSFLEATSLNYTNEPLATLYDLNIELSYPLVRTDRTPPRKQSFRTQISRNVLQYLEPRLGRTNYFFVP